MQQPDNARPGRPEDFDLMYEGTPPWDIGRPQPAFVELAAAGALHGEVLDVRCGTGEHALMAAALGFKATGMDTAGAAIAIAERKARERGLRTRFLVCDARHLETLRMQFDIVLDCLAGNHHPALRPSLPRNSSRPTWRPRQTLVPGIATAATSRMAGHMRPNRVTPDNGLSGLRRSRIASRHWSSMPVYPPPAPSEPAQPRQRARPRSSSWCKPPPARAC